VPVPYKDADGNPFDDRDFAKTSTFPPVDADARSEGRNPAWVTDRRQSACGCFQTVDNPLTRPPSRNVGRGAMGRHDTASRGGA
jgi:hypothetical protein